MDISTTFKNNLLDNHQSKAYTLAVDLSGAVKLSKPCEKLVKILFSDTNSSVSYLDD